MATVIAFPNEPREGLTDREVRAVIEWCARASGELLEVTPISWSTDEGARAVTVLDDRGEPKWLICRERGSLFMLDGDPDTWGDAVPRGTSRAVEGLREALGRDG